MKKRGFILVLISLFILSSCTSFDNYFGRNTAQIGGKGLILNFVQPSTSEISIPEGFPLNVKIELKNYIENEQGLNGELCLRDLLTDNFGGIPSFDCRPINLASPKKLQSNNNLLVEPETFNFGPYYYKNAQREFQSASQTQLIADVKYELESKAKSLICVKREGSKSAPSNCGTETKLSIEQEDLPLKITSASATSFVKDFEADLLLELTISKTSDGQVISRSNNFEQAPKGSAFVEFNLLVNSIPAKCIGLVGTSLEVTRTEKESKIKCSAKLSFNQDFIQVPIDIKMGYGFIQSVNGPVIKFGKEEDI